MKTEKDKLQIYMPPYQMDLVKKCSVAANMTYNDFFSTVLYENCLEELNRINVLRGFPKTEIKKVLKIKLPPKKDTSKKVKK